MLSTATVLVVLDTQIRPLLAVHGGGLELIEVTPGANQAWIRRRLSRLLIKIGHVCTWYTSKADACFRHH